MKTRGLTSARSLLGQPLLALVLLLSLATLAALQHRWTAKVSLSERQRLRGGINEALAHLERAFDREVTQAMLTFWVDPRGVTGRAPEHWRPYLVAMLSEANEYWQKTAALPRLVRDVLLVDIASPAEVELHRIDLDGQRLEKMSWPPELREFAQQFGEQARGLRAPFSSFGLVNDDLFFVVPAVVVERPVARGVHEPPLITTACVIVRLDPSFIAQEWLPALVERYLSGAQGDFDVVVRSGGEP